jgi:hypothetical protein
LHLKTSPDGALALKFLAATEDARISADDAIRACIWLLIALLAEEPPADRERILEMISRGYLHGLLTWMTLLTEGLHSKTANEHPRLRSVQAPES